MEKGQAVETQGEAPERRMLQEIVVETPSDDEAERIHRIIRESTPRIRPFYIKFVKRLLGSSKSVYRVSMIDFIYIPEDNICSPSILATVVDHTDELSPRYVSLGQGESIQIFEPRGTDKQATYDELF